MDEKRQKAMELLREAADILEADAEEIILPGWDLEHEDDEARAGNHDLGIHCAGVRAAAHAVLARGVSPDSGREVRIYDLGRLARYIGDMLEE